MDDCAAILALAARTTGAGRFAYRGTIGRSVRPARAPDRRRGVRALCRDRPQGAAADRRSLDGLPQSRAQAASGLPTTTPGATSSAACWSRRSSPGSDRDAPPSSTNIRPCSRRWRGRRSQTRASPSASSFMPVASNWPTGSANSPIRPSSAFASKSRWRRRPASTASAIRSMRIFIAALNVMPQACGIALGLDRLVMLATGATRIEQVVWTPLPEM